MNTFQSLLDDGYEVLKDASPTPKIDAEILLQHASKRTMSWLISHADKQADGVVLKTFYELLKKRQQGEPVAYLLGSRSFWTLDLTVTPDVLIPRPDTETLVEQALQLIPRDTTQHILDLGTGSGAIALSLAKERPKCHVLGIDKSDKALEIAKQNAEKNDIKNVSFQQSNWFAELANSRFDLIVSNPPYIAEQDPHLQQGDVRFEPISALTSGIDGLDDIRQLCKAAPTYLSGNGYLILEHGYNQHDQVQAILKQHHFNDIQTVADLNQLPRVTLGKRCK